eukprot:123285-Pleurochrysis_carterae.AAC.1
MQRALTRAAFLGQLERSAVVDVHRRRMLVVVHVPFLRAGPAGRSPPPGCATQRRFRPRLKTMRCSAGALSRKRLRRLQ